MPEPDADAESKTYLHSVRLDELLERRVQQAMELEGMSVFNEFAKRGLTRLCRQVLLDHGVDPNSPPPPLKRGTAGEETERPARRRKRP